MLDLKVNDWFHSCPFKEKKKHPCQRFYMDALRFTCNECKYYPENEKDTDEDKLHHED